MSFQKIDNILSNFDIVIHIYKLLDIEDQFRLAQVNRNMRRIFENFIWTAQYRTLAIYKQANCWEVTTTWGANRLLLTENALSEFIIYYGKEVQELYTEIAVSDVKPFKNLTTVKCAINSPFLKRVAKDIPQLEILELRGKRIFINNSPNINIDLAVLETLMEMRNLKQLCLRLNTSRGGGGCASIEYEYFSKIIYQMKLQVLKLEKIFITSPKTNNCYGNYSDSSEKHPSMHLQELHLSASRSFCKLCTIQFKNLTILQLFFDECIDNRDLKNISTSCPKLDNLTFIRTNFKDVTVFALPPKLSELHLKDCFFVNHKHLRQILTETTLKAFTSYFTSFYGDFEDFPISPLIQNLAIDGVDIWQFQSAYHNNENLKNLRWCSRREYAITALKVGPLATCKNLEIFETDYRIHPLEHIQDIHLNILQLKHLHKFSVNMGVLKDWCYLSDLLRHPPLRELHISSFVEDKALEPISGFPSNVIILSIDFDVITGTAIDFFFDLYNKNPDMKLSFSVRSWTWMQTLRRLLEHKKCINDLGTVQVCDFEINCQMFRRDFEMTAKNFRCIPSCGNYFDHSNSIVLYRPDSDKITKPSLALTPAST